MAPKPAEVMTPDPRATIQNLLACRWLARDISTALDGSGIQRTMGGLLRSDLGPICQS